MDLRGLALALCAALAVWPFAIAANEPAQPPADECGVDVPVIDVLDPGTTSATRDAGLQLLRTAAERESCPHARYLLGTLHRFGPELPGNTLEKDPARAEALLEPYARDGHVWAYADLAESALAQGDGVGAMKWTQVYLYFATRHGEALSDFDRGGYIANLLLRADRAWRKARRPAGMTLQSVLND